MKKKGSFGSLKKDSQESQNKHEKSKLTSDISEDLITEKEHTITNLKAQIETLEARFNEQLEVLNQKIAARDYTLDLKHQDIEILKQTLLKRNEEVQDLSTKIHELETKKPIDDRVTKKPLKNGIVLEMQEYALSILNNEGDFFRKIAEKFQISKSTAYRYCKDIHKSNKVKE